MTTANQLALIRDDQAQAAELNGQMAINWPGCLASVTPVRTQVEFFAAGAAAPKGSQKAIMPKYGQYPILICDNAKTKPWQAYVSALAQEAMEGHDLIDGPVRLTVVFVFHRPKSVSRKSRPLPSTKPDLDKLVRTIMDALQGRVYTQDSRVVEVRCCKQYDDIPGARQGALIRAEEIL